MLSYLLSSFSLNSTFKRKPIITAIQFKNIRNLNLNVTFSVSFRPFKNQIKNEIIKILKLIKIEKNSRIINNNVFLIFESRVERRLKMRR